MDDMTDPQKVKPKHLDSPQVAGSSIGHKPHSHLNLDLNFILILILNHMLAIL